MILSENTIAIAAEMEDKHANQEADKAEGPKCAAQSADDSDITSAGDSTTITKPTVDDPACSSTLDDGFQKAVLLNQEMRQVLNSAGQVLESVRSTCDELSKRINENTRKRMPEPQMSISSEESMITQEELMCYESILGLPSKAAKYAPLHCPIKGLNIDLNSPYFQAYQTSNIQPAFYGGLAFIPQQNVSFPYYQPPFTTYNILQPGGHQYGAPNQVFVPQSETCWYGVEQSMPTRQGVSWKKQVADNNQRTYEDAGQPSGLVDESSEMQHANNRTTTEHTTNNSAQGMLNAYPPDTSSPSARPASSVASDSSMGLRNLDLKDTTSSVVKVKKEPVEGKALNALVKLEDGCVGTVNDFRKHQVQTILRSFEQYRVEFAKPEETPSKFAEKVQTISDKAFSGYESAPRAIDTGDSDKGKLEGTMTKLNDFSENEPARRRPDLKAAGHLREKGLWLNQQKVIGNVPGVAVGDTFNYRIQLCIVGLHRQVRAGIDFMTAKDSAFNVPIATSVVVGTEQSYGDDMDMGEVMIYTGQGGLPIKNGKKTGGPCEDQKLVRGNVALKNSLQMHTPVRVIRGYKDKNKLSGVLYSYDGLYLVNDMRYETGIAGNTVFKFLLERIKGQPPLKLFPKKPASSKHALMYKDKDACDRRALPEIEKHPPMPLIFYERDVRHRRALPQIEQQPSMPLICNEKNMTEVDQQANSKNAVVEEEQQQPAAIVSYEQPSETQQQANSKEAVVEEEQKPAALVSNEQPSDTQQQQQQQQLSPPKSPCNEEDHARVEQDPVPLNMRIPASLFPPLSSLFMKDVS